MQFPAKLGPLLVGERRRSRRASGRRPRGEANEAKNVRHAVPRPRQPE